MLDALFLELLETLALAAVLLLFLSALLGLDLGSELKPPLVARNRARPVVPSKSRPAQLICILQTDPLSGRSWSDASEISRGLRGEQVRGRQLVLEPA